MTVCKCVVIKKLRKLLQGKRFSKYKCIMGKVLLGPISWDPSQTHWFIHGWITRLSYQEQGPARTQCLAPHNNKVKFSHGVNSSQYLLALTVPINSLGRLCYSPWWVICAIIIAEQYPSNRWASGSLGTEWHLSTHTEWLDTASNIWMTAS